MGLPFAALHLSQKPARITIYDPRPDLQDSEQGPENVAFKQRIWPQIEAAAPADALLWSSTSGIPASVQGQSMQDGRRLLVAHPFNPPHVMPLIEIVPFSSADASTDASAGAETVGSGVKPGQFQIPTGTRHANLLAADQ